MLPTLPLQRWVKYFLIEFLCNFFTRFLHITYIILSCLSLRFLKYLLCYIFLWFMAFRNLEFMYGTCAFSVLVLMGAYSSNIDMNNLSCIRLASSISSNIPHTWKGIETTSFWQSFSEKCFILLYVNLCLGCDGANILRIHIKNMKITCSQLSVTHTRRTFRFVRKTPTRVGISPFKQVGCSIRFTISIISHRSERTLCLNQLQLKSP